MTNPPIPTGFELVDPELEPDVEVQKNWKFYGWAFCGWMDCGSFSGLPVSYMGTNGYLVARPIEPKVVCATCNRCVTHLPKFTIPDFDGKTGKAECDQCGCFVTVVAKREVEE